VGPYKLSYGQLFGLIQRWAAGDALNPAEATALAVIFHIRLARIVLAGLVGLGLSLAGAAFQGILLNPLAEPFTLGVAAGAAFGASLALSLGFAGALWGSLGLLPLMALLGAAAALALVLALGSMAGGIQHGTLILAGVIVSAFLSSSDQPGEISLRRQPLHHRLLDHGEPVGPGLGPRAFALPYVAVGSLILLLYARELNLLTLGDASAQQLGLSVSRVRLILLLAASLITAGAVAVSGIIGFVGLIVPHLARLLVGPDHRRLLPVAGPGRGRAPHRRRHPGPGHPALRPGAPGGDHHRAPGRPLFLLPPQGDQGANPLMIRVENLTVAYGERVILEDLNFQVAEGEFVGFLGPNGSGKSTLLNALTALVPLRSGQVWYNGAPLESWPPRALARQVAVVPQFTWVGFPFTCFEVVLMGRYPYRRRFQGESPADLDAVRRAMRRNPHRGPGPPPHYPGVGGRTPTGDAGPGPGPGHAHPLSG
jgi:iron complex transport system permease protein